MTNTQRVSEHRPSLSLPVRLIKPRNRCSCEDMAHDRECRIEGTYYLEARALNVGTICDACALTHYSNVVTGVGDWSMTEDSQGFRVRVENHTTGEVIADFYGPTRITSARALLWEQYWPWVD